MQYQAADPTQVFRPPVPSALAPQPGLDWVTGPSPSYSTDAAYAAPYRPQAGPAVDDSFGAYEEEPPLLEGRRLAG